MDSYEFAFNIGKIKTIILDEDTENMLALYLHGKLQINLEIVSFNLTEDYRNFSEL